MHHPGNKKKNVHLSINWWCCYITTWLWRYVFDSSAAAGVFNTYSTDLLHCTVGWLNTAYTYICISICCVFLLLIWIMIQYAVVCNFLYKLLFLHFEVKNNRIGYKCKTRVPLKWWFWKFSLNSLKKMQAHASNYRK